jgi:hypothetical protein
VRKVVSKMRRIINSTYVAGSSGRFELADSTSLDSGIVILTYRILAS